MEMAMTILVSNRGCFQYRKSFHGYPPGTAQLLDSPTEFIITPMQIE